MSRLVRCPTGLACTGCPYCEYLPEKPRPLPLGLEPRNPVLVEPVVISSATFCGGRFGCGAEMHGHIGTRIGEQQRWLWWICSDDPSHVSAALPVPPVQNLRGA